MSERKKKLMERLTTNHRKAFKARPNYHGNRRDQGPASDENRPWVYAMGCSFHGPIRMVGLVPTEHGPGLPCCPYCQSMLMQVDSPKTWWDGVAEHEAGGHTNYEPFMRWTVAQKRCWPSLKAAALDFAKETGKTVKF